MSYNGGHLNFQNETKKILQVHFANHWLQYSHSAIHVSHILLILKTYRQYRTNFSLKTDTLTV